MIEKLNELEYWRGNKCSEWKDADKDVYEIYEICMLCVINRLVNV